MLNILEANPIDPEQLALLNNFFKHDVPGFTGRGYTILDSNKDDNKTVCLSRGFEYYSGKSKPVWFMYSGMGSQWAGMGEGLLRIPVFAAAIERCHKILLAKGLNITDIITDKNSKKLNILNSLIAITAIQIGLTDVLKSIGIMPDNIIGHSVGEIGAGYADESLTTEEAILAAYFRALVSYEGKFIKGTMAAVGLGHKQVAELCPPEIEIACHNSFESTTISGPADIVSVFVKSLTDRGIFAKEVNSYDIAFHSKYIAKSGPVMLNHLKTVLTDPKVRSNKWLSTCYLPEHWHKNESRYASAEYFTHNLMGCVLFEEAAAFIPEGAIIIEIAPHGLLQAILKRSHKECLNLSLTRRDEADGATLLLKSIGRLYQVGLNPDLADFYPKVEFPVSSETPLLSHFVKWNHEMDWKLVKLDVNEGELPIFKELSFSLTDDDFAYLKYHMQNDVVVLPESLILVSVWDTLATFEKKDYKNTIVAFDNIQFYKIITIQPDEVLKLTVSVQKGSKKFEVCRKENVVADGNIILMKKCNKKYENCCVEEDEMQVTQNNINKLLRMRGYNYNEEFSSIISANIKRNKATIKWNNCWVTLLDSLIQIKALSNDHDGISSVKSIRKLTINTDEHKRRISTNGVQCYNAFLSDETGVTESGGASFEDMVLNNISRSEEPLILERNLKINKRCHNINLKNETTGNVVSNSKLICKEQSDFESLTWADTSTVSNKGIIQVHYSGLSTRDCKKLCSFNNHSFGMDFSGVDINGNRVMGLVREGAMASTVEADYNLLWPVPEHWSLAEAATVPLPYVHAFYCLAIRHKLDRNNNILVLGGAGALGQAIISIALHIGCTVFATVGNPDKKRFLLNLFPELDGDEWTQYEYFTDGDILLILLKLENNIGYTYDDTFHIMVVEKTKHRKCNIVINTATGIIREDAMKCVSEDLSGNVLLDVNDNDQHDNKKFCMSYLKLEKAYKSVNLSTIFIEKYFEYKKVLQRMLCEGIVRGYVRPLTSVVFSPSEVSRAFKLLANRINRGRVVINIRELNTSKEDLRQIPRMTLNPDKVYILICDESELGVELVDLLIQRGAKHLIINLSPNTINGYFHVKHALWTKKGANIKLNSDNLRKEDESQAFMDNAMKLGPIDGIFITYSDVANGIHIQETDKYNEETHLIVCNLDRKSRKCKSLRYFAVISATQNSTNNSIKEIENNCSLRNDVGLPSTHLHHVFSDKMWRSKSINIIFNALETSLKHNLVSVSTSEEKLTNKTIFNENRNTDFSAGFKAFYQNIQEDEFDATEPIVQLKTMCSSDYEHELGLDPSDDYIIMIPGFDGNAETLRCVAERLNKSVMALQIIPNFNDSISEIAKNLLHHLKRRIKLRSPFRLVGYSFGVNIALEMAALMEREGYVGVVCCVDSSPDALSTHLDAYLCCLTDEHLQNSLIEHIYTLFTNHESIDLRIKLQVTTNWAEKLDLFMKIAKTNVTHSHEYMGNFLQAAYERLQMTKEYRPKFVLESDLVLIKGIAHPDAKELSNDYDLSAYSNKPVKVYDIYSDHAMALSDCRISNIINRSFVQ